MEQSSRSNESSIEEALRECIEDVIDAFDYEPSRGSIPQLADALTDAVQSRFIKRVLPSALEMEIPMNRMC